MHSTIIKILLIKSTMCLKSTAFILCVLLQCTHSWLDINLTTAFASTCNFKEVKQHVILHKEKVSSSIEGTKLDLSVKYEYESKTTYSLIETDAFHGLVNLTVIHLQGNNIQSLDAEIFKDLKLLKEINICTNYLCDIQNGTFMHLPSLEILNLCYNCLKILNKKSFLGLISLKFLDLSFNSISTIENGAFKYLELLEDLDLYSNCLFEFSTDLFIGLTTVKSISLGNNNLHKLHNGTFKHTMSLQKLDLYDKKLKELNAEIFQGLKLLTSINLEHNKLHVLGTNPFKYLTSVQTIVLHFNHLKEIYFHSFHFVALKNINLEHNQIRNCTFSHLKQMKKISLNENMLSHIPKVMFMGLINLTSLNLMNNRIGIIDQNAFKDLTNLKNLSLSNNKIRILANNMFLGLENINLLYLSNNSIHHIEENAFMGILPVKQKLVIELMANKISGLEWTVFISSSTNISQNMKILDNFKAVAVYLDGPNFQCKRHLCWMEHLEFQNIFSFSNSFEKYYLHHRRKRQNFLKNICGKMLKNCPHKDTWCMYAENDTCEEHCKGLGKIGGSLIVDGNVCPFQYFCQCTCPSCEAICAKQGKINVRNETDMFGCSICNCQCDNPNCWKLCGGPNFLLQNSTFGCLECRCVCPEVDCDVKCQRTGLGLIKINENNCTGCDGCSKHKAKKNGVMLRNTLVLGILSTTILSLVFIFVIYLLKRKTKNVKTDLSHAIHEKQNVLDTLTQNLDPDLAQKIKESWIDPKKFCVQLLLGHGQFGVIWSGIYEKSPGRKFLIALKAAKAEYQDKWTVETKWNCNNELKPCFSKGPVQVQLDNQTIEDLLIEAALMRKFCHPNILNIHGVSMYEERPCILLPLMKNGDLRKYLKTNGANLTSKDLNVFALGVAAGMAYLTEQEYVHCDLAARNCLLDVNLHVKISDFGLAKDVKSGNNQKREGCNKPMPIRWMSVETIESGMFKFESDVWSYGVVLWEIFSCGLLPYKDIENTDVFRYLLKGHRLEKPANCLDLVYEIMLGCWENNPDNRPRWNTIIDLLNKIADREADYTEVKDDSADKRQKEDILQEKNPTAGSTSVPGDREAELLVKSCSKMPKKKDAKQITKVKNENLSTYQGYDGAKL